MTAGERSGWRDADLSRRHRRWGFNCPGVDLDFVMVEYHLGEPVAIVEYKHHAAGGVDLDHPTYTAIRSLADRSPAVPFLVARYWPDTWAFQATPVNWRAREIFGPGPVDLSEAEYVRLLHSLRQLTVQETVLRNLNAARPPRPMPATA